MIYNKPAINFSKQVIRLKELGLLFKDEQKAEKILSQISFYRLRAYTYPFQDNTDPNHTFKVEIYFENIIELYDFDRKLRLLILDAIEKIEIALRTQIIYQFSLQYGSHWQTNSSIFRKLHLFNQHQNSLQKEINRSDETFIEHYINKYSSPVQPPAWMSMEVASFGTLSKFYQNLKNGKEKKAVSNSFGLPNPMFLENWMLCFSHLRNISAHHGRLWNRRLITKPKLPYNTKKIFLSKNEIKSIYPNKLYATLCIISYILKEIDSTNGFNSKFLDLMNAIPLNQEKAMGFIDDWRNHPLWK